MGNTCLYGATGGRLYAAGRAVNVSARVLRRYHRGRRHWREPVVNI
ncbi:hypothetical protein ACNKHV_20280 [Shigella flexneri]